MRYLIALRRERGSGRHQTSCRLATVARQHRQVAHGTRPVGSAWALMPCVLPREPLRGPWHEESAALADAIARLVRQSGGRVHMWALRYRQRVGLVPAMVRRMTREVG